VLWEAQFGDFANGAQTIVDEFISSAEQKWGQRSGVVLLLPHGYEGQGPDHSSARIERYLQMCAENNMTVARPSTPASYFHLLRRQAYARPRRPLIVFTPKAMLRLRGATSQVDEFTQGKFEPVIDDVRVADKSGVKRVVLTSGKIYYDLLAELGKRDNQDEVAIVRIEQFYPMPIVELNDVLEQYPNADLIWAQDEPENQGAWPFFSLELSKRVTSREVKVSSRGASASPATGSNKRSAQEQAALINRALTI
jgi:2-oxoglutarate dehydrogenase E1 component